jgi:hypothetical protein
MTKKEKAMSYLEQVVAYMDVHVAKAMALSTLDLFTQPALRQAAKDEFFRSTGGKQYVSPLPEGAKPH